ncbi:MAG: 4-alpha-glucanotransferase [Vicinamibacterales bacterium]
MLGIHTSAFPPGTWDTGYGAPLSDAGQRLLTFAARLGFTALQLGPSGQVSQANLSPYDGTVFARNTWSIDLRVLTEREWGPLLPADIADRLALGPVAASRVQPQRVDRIVREAADACYQGLVRLRTDEPDHPLLLAFDRFRVDQRGWLELNAAYEVIAGRKGDDPDRFDSDTRALFAPGAGGPHRRTAWRAAAAAAFECRELAQFLCHAQHATFRSLARAEGLALWGDLQVGFSHRDRFLHADCFTPRWWLGAPPSRTNPDGQPWGYPVLDPDQLDDPTSPARQLFELRLRKLLAEYDGVRIDHPHGLVCPWIYAAADPDRYGAVRRGTRAFASPNSPDPDLARWAIARSTNLNPAAGSPFADDWVRDLDESQVSRYARLLDALVSLSQDRGRARDVVAAEVLSTCPYPLSRVLARHGLGRFRVTEKFDPSDPNDPYRTEHARPEDWLMLGTHDTPPALPLATQWVVDGRAVPRATYLADRLIDDPAARRAAAERFAGSAPELLGASLADLFGSRAESVYVFIGDLFGETEPFNRAGIIHPDNWTARLPADFERVYAERLHAGRALDIVAALRLALTRTLPELPV